ncbi:hypothetical protein SFUMM280S_07064 [Streptomyces fumanus]
MNSSTCITAHAPATSSLVSLSAMIRRAVSSRVRPMIFPIDASSTRRESASCGCAKPSPISVEPARALSRSRTCLRNRATRKPSAATGTVHRKTVWMVSA